MSSSRGSVIDATVYTYHIIIVQITIQKEILQSADILMTLLLKDILKIYCNGGSSQSMKDRFMGVILKV